MWGAARRSQSRTGCGQERLARVKVVSMEVRRQRRVESTGRIVSLMNQACGRWRGLKCEQGWRGGGGMRKK